MASFVLVHGTFVGGWVWRKLEPLLSSQGHVVYTPTLTGLGERAHLASQNVGLRTHILDIANVLRFEDLADVILVGHSYGGLVVAGVADRLPDKIGHLVFLDAIVPFEGESLLDHVELGPEDDSGRIPVPRAFEQVDGEEAWMNGKFTPFPAAAAREKLTLSAPLESQEFRLTYVKATETPRTDRAGRQTFSWRAREHAAGGGRWTVVNIDTDHTRIVTRPSATASALLSIASADG